MSSYDEWAGGYYELAICLGPRDDARLAAAAAAMVRAAGIVESVDALALFSDSRADGRIVLPFPTERPLLAARDVACAVIVIREGSDDDPGDDWIDLCRPLASLGRVVARVGGYPFGDREDCVRSLAWRRPLDEWLVSVGRAVFAAARFRYALVGCEVSGEALPNQHERYCCAVTPDGDGLSYVPATM